MYTKLKIESLINSAGGYVNSNTEYPGNMHNVIYAQWVVYPTETKTQKIGLLKARTDLISKLRKDGWTVTTNKDYGRGKILILKTEIKVKK